MTTTDKNLVLRTVYIDPEVDDELRNEAFDLRTSKNELLRNYLRIGMQVAKGLADGNVVIDATAAKAASAAVAAVAATNGPMVAQLVASAVAAAVGAKKPDTKSRAGAAGAPAAAKNPVTTRRGSAAKGASRAPAAAKKPAAKRAAAAG